jgi:uncharacterized protein involved in exopolysaccharide biosynthesis
MAISEAQQRRVFFEQQMQATQAKLAQAQVALQVSGFNPGAIKAEPRAAAESYARLKAESTSAEVRLQTMRGMLADTSTEVVQQEKILAELRRQLARQESGSPAGNDADYIGRYREYKYQETLLELMARQYELARVDESREGALIQVLDTATAPERRSKPKRLMVALAAATSAFLLICMVVLVRAGRSA